MVTAGILPFRENSHGRTGNRTRDLMISSQRLRPLDHEAGRPSIRLVIVPTWLSRFHRMWKKNTTVNHKSVIKQQSSSLSYYSFRAFRIADKVFNSVIPPIFSSTSQNINISYTTKSRLNKSCKEWSSTVQTTQVSQKRFESPAVFPAFHVRLLQTLEQMNSFATYYTNLRGNKYFSFI